VRGQTDATARAQDAREFLDSRTHWTAGYAREVASKLRAYYRWRVATGRSPRNVFGGLWTIPNAPAVAAGPDAAAYLAYREAVSSPETVAGARRTLARWTRFLAARGRTPSTARFDDAAAFLGAHAKGWGAGSVYRATSTLRTFHAWLLAAGRAEGANPWSMRAPTPSRSIPDVLTPAHWRRLEAAMQAAVDGAQGRWRVLGLRRYATIRFMFFAGARSIEARRLRAADVDFAERYAHLHGKGGRKPKERKAPFDARTGEVLQLYLREGRPQLTRDWRGLIVRRRLPRWRLESKEDGLAWAGCAVVHTLNETDLPFAVRRALAARAVYHLLRLWTVGRQEALRRLTAETAAWRAAGAVDAAPPPSGQGL
jgi:site-specific recombinase XerD